MSQRFRGRGAPVIFVNEPRPTYTATLATIWSNAVSPTMIKPTIAANARMILLSEVRRFIPCVADDEVIVSEADSSGTLLGLLKVVLGNRRHRLLQDLWIPPTPLREPRDDEQNRTDEEDREPDDLRGDR